jgi:hypothetical protein
MLFIPKFCSLKIPSRKQKILSQLQDNNTRGTKHYGVVLCIQYTAGLNVNEERGYPD